jgi:hypothetical protein
MGHPVRRREVGLFCLFLLAGALYSPALSAQENGRERGYFGLGLGAGTLGCSECDGREVGLSGFAKFGGVVNNRWLLGIELNFWAKDAAIVVGSVEGGPKAHSLYSANAYFYPDPGRAFFVRGGIGLAGFDLTKPGFGAGAPGGFGLVVGLGLDSTPSGNLTLTPFANVLLGVFDGVNSNVLQLGVGLTWH